MNYYQPDMPAYRLLRACYDNPNQVGYHEICHFLSMHPREHLQADLVSWGGLTERLTQHMAGADAVGLGAMECLAAYLDAAAAALENTTIPPTYVSSSDFGLVYDTLVDTLRKMRSVDWHATPLLRGLIAHKLWTPERLLAVFDAGKESGFKKQAGCELTKIAIPLLLDTEWIPQNAHLLHHIWELYEPNSGQHLGGERERFLETISTLLHKLPETLPSAWIAANKRLYRASWGRAALDYYFPMPLHACSAEDFVQAFGEMHAQAAKEEQQHLMALLHAHHPQVAELFELHFSMMSLASDDYTYLTRGFRLARGENIAKEEETILGVGHLFEDA